MNNKRYNQAWGLHGANGLHGLRCADYYFLFFIAYFLFPALVSCTSDEEPAQQPTVEEPVVEEPGEGVSMSFAARFADAVETESAAKARATRAVDPEPGDGEMTDELLKSLGFGVYCWYTGTNYFDPDFTAPKTHIKDYLGATGYMLMRNQKVEWKAWDGVTDSWGYTPMKYWPTDPNERLTLRAYAPYTNYLVTDAHGMPQLSVVVTKDDYHNGAQHDPLWGTSKHDGTVDADDAVDPEENEVYGKHYNNYTYPMSGNQLAPDNRDGTIFWYFHHGMSRLQFSCSIIPDPGCDNVTITSISITPLYTQGLLSPSSATASEEEKPTWTERGGEMTVTLNEGDPSTTAGDLAPIPTPDPEPLDFNPYPFTIDIVDDPASPTGPLDLLPKGLLIIPRDYRSPNTPMTISITYYIDGLSSDKQTAVGTIPRIFYGNTSYTLGLSLTPSTKGLDITLVQSAFTPWIIIPGDHEVYNW